MLLQLLLGGGFLRVCACLRDQCMYSRAAQNVTFLTFESFSHEVLNVCHQVLCRYPDRKIQNPHLIKRFMGLNESY